MEIRNSGMRVSNQFDTIQAKKFNLKKKENIKKYDQTVTVD